MNETAALVTDDGIFAKREAELSGYASTSGVQLQFWTLDEVEPKLRYMLEETAKVRFSRHQQLASAALSDALPEIQRVFNENRDWYNATLRSSYMYGGQAWSNIQFNAVTEVNVAVLDHEPQVGDEIRILAYLSGLGVYTRFDASTGGMTLREFSDHLKNYL